MHPESRFIVRKVWELVELCAEQRGRCRWVNMNDFRDALDSGEIGRKDACGALRELERRNYLLAMTRGDDDEITDIVITPERFRCHECRLVISSRLDWEEHLPDCLRQQEKMRRLGLIVRAEHQVILLRRSRTYPMHDRLAPQPLLETAAVRGRTVRPYQILDDNCEHRD